MPIFDASMAKGRGRRNALRRGEDLSGVHLWLVLWKAWRAVQAHAYRSIAAQPIGESDFGVLEALLHKGPMPVNTIGRRVLLTSGSITAAVDRLEAQGFVERQAHASDRRARIVHLTPVGERLIKGVFGQHKQDMEQAAMALSRPERTTLIRLLKKLGFDAERSLALAAKQAGTGAPSTAAGSARRRRPP
jgi:MarR family 2-MHQ and catechol resistance regulon transcriptional repressor